MMNNSELSRLRRQMQRRIRFVLAQRRLDGSAAVHPRRSPERLDRRDGPSGEPAPED